MSNVEIHSICASTEHNEYIQMVALSDYQALEKELKKFKVITGRQRRRIDRIMDLLEEARKDHE